jgi:hypothetical protein
MNNDRSPLAGAFFSSLIALSGCAAHGEWAPIDRFSAAAGHLQLRTATNGIPGPDRPIDCDHPPFITQSRGPAGEIIRYYNFDVQPTTPGSIYLFFASPTATEPLAGQAPIVDAIPGDPGYSDFLRVVKVIAPAGYRTDSLRDLASIKSAGLQTIVTDGIVNRPIVPRGSTARERLNGASPALESGWYRGRKVQWFRFDETKLAIEEGDRVPISPIYVTFNKNPDQPGGGPPSGFRTEPDGFQTHNVASSLPGDLDYSPLWLVSFYDNVFFPSVKNESTVLQARIVGDKVATVNCPVVFVKSE